jgi:hypothetical protein
MMTVMLDITMAIGNCLWSERVVRQRHAMIFIQRVDRSAGDCGTLANACRSRQVRRASSDGIPTIAVDDGERR